MDASRRGRPGVLTGLLLAARLRRDRFALALRQGLVFGPLLAQVAALRRRHLDELLVGLARVAALLGRELRPALHAPRDALLLFRLHRRIALGDADPLAPALGLEAFPVGLQRREGLLLLGSELGPRRAYLRLGFCGRLGLRRGLARYVDRRLGERAPCPNQCNDEEPNAPHSSATRFFSQF